MTYREALRRPPLRRLGVLAAAAVTTLALLAPVPTSAAPAADGQAARQAAPQRLITYTEWDTRNALATGHRAGVAISSGRLVLGRPVGQRRFGGRSYDLGAWTSPWVRHHAFS